MTSQISAVFGEFGRFFKWKRGWHLFSLCVTLMFSVRSEIVITGVGMNSLCNFTKYYSCEISLNVNFNKHLSEITKVYFNQSGDKCDELARGQVKKSQKLLASRAGSSNQTIAHDTAFT